MIVVSNSSPLIALSIASSMDLLHSLYGTIYIPEAVFNEVAIRIFRRNPTNGVGGAFILNLRGTLTPDSQIPQTQLVDRSYLALISREGESEQRVRLGMNDPPTSLVGF